MPMLATLTEEKSDGGRCPRWFVAETHVHQERHVARSLAQAEYVAHLPMNRVRRKDKKVTLGWRWDHAPMFGNYLFFKLDPTVTPWTPIRYTEGVRRIFMTLDQRPIPVPVGFVEALIADAPARLKLPDVETPAFPRNTLLRVVSGPLTGQCARCVRSDQVRTDVEIEMFGGRVAVQMPNSALGMWEAGLSPV